ncbi:hypothetical protein HZU77_007005 [Neisseriaceae bacterium TC5R-5]|nr:hypothetical protein [Neisseriaceae bacterium TC5R-5]
MIQIQATFSGYSGRPCSLFSVYDPAARILVISLEAAYRETREPACVVISNDRHIPRDVLFSDEHLLEAISAYYTLKQGVAADGQSRCLDFDEDAMRANPESHLEQDGIDTNGPRYRLNDGVTCCHIATLATCWYVLRADTITQTLDMAAWLAHGGIITI